MKYILCSIVVGCGTALAGSPVLAQPAHAPSATVLLAPARMGVQASSNPNQVRLDQDFLRAATEGGLNEVTLGHLAAHKSDNAEIRAFGNRMVRDHTRINNEVGPIAKRLGVTPPEKLDAEDQAEYDKLGLLPVAEFNKAYVRLMVMAHRKDLQAFKHEANVAADPQLKRVVAAASMVIAEHLSIITHLAGTLGIAVDGPTQGAA